MIDSLFMWSGTGSFCHCHSELRSDQSCTLLWHQSCWVEVGRSWVHVCVGFSIRGKEGGMEDIIDFPCGR